MELLVCYLQKKFFFVRATHDARARKEPTHFEKAEVGKLEGSLSLSLSLLSDYTNTHTEREREREKDVVFATRRDWITTFFVVVFVVVE